MSSAPSPARGSGQSYPLPSFLILIPTYNNNKPMNSAMVAGYSDSPNPLTIMKMVSVKTYYIFSTLPEKNVLGGEGRGVIITSSCR